MAKWNKQLKDKYTRLIEEKNKVLKQLFETKLNQKITVVFEDSSQDCVGKVSEVGNFWFELEVETYKDNFKDPFVNFLFSELIDYPFEEEDTVRVLRDA